MTKKEAIEEFVQRRFSPIPTEWVQIIAEKNGEYPTLPMWGTMWQIDGSWGERLLQRTHMVDSYNYEDDDEEMNGEQNVLDVMGYPTAMYIYRIDGRHLIGVHGAGWDFYDGVWDKLYDLLGLCWHIEESYANTYPDMEEMPA